jgi:hypothetical protein
MAQNYIDTGRTGQPSLKSFGQGTYEKGQVVALGYGGPGGVSGLLPRPANNYTDLDQWWEYIYSLVGKGILTVSGRAAGAAISSATVAANGAVTVQIAGLAGSRLSLVSAWSDKHHIAEDLEKVTGAAIGADGKAAVEVPIPDAVRRSRAVHVARLLLKTGDGRVADWATVALPVETPLRIAEVLPFSRDWFKNGENPQARVSVQNAGPDAAVTVTADMTDSYGRVVWSETRQVKLPANGQTEADFTPALDRAMTVYHVFRVSLSDSQDRWAWEDFGVGVNCTANRKKLRI